MTTQNNNEPDVDESEKATEGPGQARMKPFSIVAVAGYLVVISALALYGLIKLWPYPTPSGETTKSENQADNSQKLIASTPCPAPNEPQASPSPSPSASATSQNARGTDPAQSAATPAARPAESQTGPRQGTGSQTNVKQPVRAAKSTQPQNATNGQSGSPSDQPSSTTSANDSKGEEKGRPNGSQSADSNLPKNQEPSTKKALPDPECISFFGTSAVPVYLETRLLLLVMLSGALGSLMHALRSLYWYTGNRLMVWSWVAYYLLLPLTGAILAVIFYFVVRGGFFSPQSTFDQTSPFGFAALSALVGLFSPQATLKLKEIAETIFSKPSAGADNKPQGSDSQASSTRPAPTIAVITPSSDKETREILITGTGFAPGAVVKFGAAPAQVTATSDNTIAVSAPDSTVPGPVDVVVTNVDGQLASVVNGFTYTLGGTASGTEVDDLDGHDEIKSNTTDEDLPVTEGGVA